MSADQSRVGRRDARTRNLLWMRDLKVLWRACRFFTLAGTIETTARADNNARAPPGTQPRACPEAPLTTVTLAGRAATPRRTDFSKNGRAALASAGPTRV